MGRKRRKSKLKSPNTCTTKDWSCASNSRTEYLQRQESHEDQDSIESDIPGYYFDPEKKTYFKILPNHLACGGSFVTRDTINRSRNDARHEKSKRREAKPNFKVLSSTFSGTRRSKNERSHSIMHSLYSAQIGQTPSIFLKNHLMRQRYSQMNTQSSWSLSEVLLPSFGFHLEALQRMELNSKHDKAVCVWSVEMDMSQKIHLMSISYNGTSKVCSEDRKCFPIKMQPSRSYGVTSSSKISSLCWSPLSSHPGKLCVLYTTIFPLGDFNSKVSISNLEAMERGEVNIFDFSLGRGAVWSSAWNRVNGRFSVGCERKCQVVDVHARKQWVYSTGNSDALAQLFSVENPHLLYSGTRNGNILIHDLRRTSTNQTITRLNQKMAVVCLRSPADENYLYASDFSGLICLWDLRLQKIVLKYSGLVNSHYQLPFYLDETENFVYGTGSDGHCKLFDQATGEVITTIAPPIRDMQSECLPMFPISHFSGRWTGHSGTIGAITGMGRKFFLTH